MFCKKCGAEIEQGMKFCTQCGTPVSGQENIQPAGKKQKKKTGKVRKFFRRLFIGILAFVILYCAAVLVGYIEIKNLKPVVPDPAGILNLTMNTKRTDSLDGIKYSAEVTQNPETKVKDYVSELKAEYGFEVDYYGTYGYRLEDNLYYGMSYDVSFFGDLAYNMFGMDIPGVYVQMKRNDETAPYSIEITIDETITVE